MAAPASPPLGHLETSSYRASSALCLSTTLPYTTRIKVFKQSDDVSSRLRGLLSNIVAGCSNMSGLTNKIIEQSIQEAAQHNQSNSKIIAGIKTVWKKSLASTESDAKRTDSDDEDNNYSCSEEPLGSVRLADSAITDLLAYLSKALSQKKAIQGITPSQIEKLLFSIFLDAMANAVKHVQKKKIEEGYPEDSRVTLDDIFRVMITTLNTYQVTSAAIAVTERITIKVDREKALDKLFAPLHDALLKMFLTHGLRIKDGVVKTHLTNTYINQPHLLYIPYTLFSGPAIDIAAWEKEFNNLEDAPQLKIFAIDLAKVILLKTRKFIGEPKSALSRCIVSQMADLSEDVSAQARIPIFAADLLAQVSSDSKHMESFWDYFENRIITLITKAIMNASVHETENRLLSPIPTIMERLYPIFKNFYLSHGSQLSAEARDSAEHHPEGLELDVKHFETIANQLLKLSGLHAEPLLHEPKSGETPKPDNLQVTFNKNMPEWIRDGFANIPDINFLLSWVDPKAALKHFQGHHIKHSSSHNAIDPAKSKFLSELADKLTNQLMGVLPELIVETSSEKHADSLAHGLAELCFDKMTGIVPVTQFKIPLTKWIVEQIQLAAKNHSDVLANEIINDFFKNTETIISKSTKAKEHRKLASLIRKWSANPIESLESVVVGHLKIMYVAHSRTDSDSFFAGLHVRLQNVNADTEQLWGFIAKQIKFTATQVLYNFFLDSGYRIFTTISECFRDRDNNPTFFKAFQDMKQLPKSKEEYKKWIIEIFSEAVNELWSIVDSDEKLKLWGLNNFLKDELAQLLMRLYIQRDLLKKDAKEGNLLKLSDLLRPGMNERQGYYREVGVLEPASRIQKGCNALADQIIIILKDRLQEAYSAKLHKELDEELDNELNVVIDASRLLLQEMLPKVFIALANNLQGPVEVAAQEAPPNFKKVNFLLADLLIRFFDIVARHTESAEKEGEKPLRVKVNAIITSSPTSIPRAPDLKTEELRNLFMPFVTEVLTLVGDNTEEVSHPLAALPIPKGMKKALWQSAKESLADFSAEAYIETEKNLTLKDHLTGHTKESAKVIGAFTAAFTRHMLSNKDPNIAHLINLLLSRLSRSTSEPMQLFAESIKGQETSIVNWVLANGQRLGMNSTKSVDAVFKYVERNVSVLSERMIDGIDKTINLVDDPIFAMTLATDIMKLTEEHIVAVNAVATAEKTSNPAKVPNGKMLNGLKSAGLLHPSLDSIGKTKEQAQQAELEHFFEPMSKLLLEISRITAKDMPAPNAMQETMFKFFKEQFPTLLKTMYESFSSSVDPKKIPGEPLNPLKLMLVIQLEELCSQLTKPVDIQEAELKREEESLKLRAMNDMEGLFTRSGTILKHALDWMPHLYTKALFKNTNVTEQGAQLLGKGVFRTVGSLSLKTIFQRMLQSSVQSLHPGTWNERNFVPQIAEKDVSSGKVEIKAAFEMQFKWSVKKEDLDKEKAKRVEKATGVWNELLKKSQALGNNGFNIAVSQWLDNKWQQTETAIDDFLFKIFGVAAAPIQCFVKTLIKIICKSLALALCPLYLIGEAVKRIETAYKVRQFHDNINLPIHESLMRKWLITTLTAIRDERNRKTEGDTKRQSEGEVKIEREDEVKYANEGEVKRRNEKGSAGPFGEPSPPVTPKHTLLPKPGHALVGAAAV